MSEMAGGETGAKGKGGSGHSSGAADEMYRTIFESAFDGILVETMDGVVLDCNEAASRMFGRTREELVGMKARDLVPQDVRPQIDDFASTRQTMDGLLSETTALRADATVFPSEVGTRVVTLDGQPRVIVYARDITRRKKADAERELLRAQLMQAQKYEIMGMLASGVAHEINNPMQVIVNYSQLLARKLPAGSQEREFCEEIQAEGFRVADTVRGLQSMTRPQSEAPHPESVADIVASTLMLFGSVQVNEDIVFESQIPGDLDQVLCRRMDFQQILMNLFGNARDALNRRYPDLQQEGPKDKRIAVSACVRKDGARTMVRVTVKDTGGGIGPEVLPRIFDPFFTTKPVGLGTGLGLTVSRQLAREGDGDLTVESEPGQLTSFHLDLPAAV